MEGEGGQVPVFLPIVLSTLRILYSVAQCLAHSTDPAADAKPTLAIASLVASLIRLLLSVEGQTVTIKLTVALKKTKIAELK